MPTHYCKLIVRHAMVVTAIAAIGAGALAADWPSFRGNPALTGVATSVLVPHNRPTWAKKIGSVTATTAIVGDTVYAATQDGKLMALNLANGAVRWQAQGKNAFTSSPCVVNGVLYIGDEGGYIHAVNAANGRNRWALKTNDKIISSCNYVNGMVLVGSYDHTLYCLNASTGRVKWKHKIDMQVHCTPCVAGNRAVISGCDGVVRLIDLTNGKQRASAALEGTNFAASAAYSGGKVFAGSLNGIMLCVNQANGKVLWQVPEKAMGAAIYSSPAATPAMVVYASRSRNVYGVNPGNGHTAWTFATKGDVDSSPTISGSNVFVGDDSGAVYGLDLRTGRQVWRFYAGGAIKASPAFGANAMVIGSTDGFLYCFR